MNERAATSRYLFVYGLLRRASGHVVAEGLMDGARHVGLARAQGRLFDNGGYPGVIDSDDPADLVIGDVFEITEDPAFLERLDAFEACGPADPEPHEYRRAVRSVKTAAGDMQSWIYLYNRPVDGKRRIASGDFLADISIDARKRVMR
ncbi:MAG: gamma-glutamylcyclotransferase family protein [Pseudomonadota bacterium]